MGGIDLGKKHPSKDMALQPETGDTLKNHNPNEHHNAKKVSLGPNTKR